MKKLGHILCLLAVFQIAGGHWLVLQTIAWTKMTITYSQEFGWELGLSKTFDGDHPCEMCQQVEKGRQSESELPPLYKVDKKTEKIFVENSPLAAPINFTECDWRQLDLLAIARFYSPLLPPPRSQS